MRRANRAAVLAMVVATVLTAGLRAAEKPRRSDPEGGFVVAAEYDSLQEAVDALPQRRGMVFVPPGKYVLEKTLNLSYPPGGYRGGITIIGAGRTSKIVARTSGKPAIDLTGANHCIMRDLNIEAEYTGKNEEQYPNVGLLLARNANGDAAQEHRFSNVNILGHFTLANVYNITSELDRFEGCIFINKAPGAHNFVWSSDNFAGVESPYQGKIRTLYSNTELRIYGCTFYNWGGGEGGSNIHMRGFTMDTTVRDCYMNPPEGGCAVYLGMSSKGGPMRSTEFDGIRIEGGNAADIFRVEGRAENLTVRHCSMFYGEGKALSAEKLINFTWEHNDVWNIRGWKTALSVEEMIGGRIRSNMFTFHNWGGKNPQEGPQVAVQVGQARGSIISAPRRELVRCEKMSGTLVRATAEEGGVARRYLGTAARGEVLNMEPVNTAGLKHLKAGDVALDDGTNTESGKVGLAVYDGKKWQYMN